MGSLSVESQIETRVHSNINHIDSNILRYFHFLSIALDCGCQHFLNVLKVFYFMEAFKTHHHPNVPTRFKINIF